MKKLILIVGVVVSVQFAQAQAPCNVVIAGGMPVRVSGDGYAVAGTKECMEEAPKAVVVDEETKSILEKVTKDIRFKTGSAELEGSSYQILDILAGALKKHPEYDLSIEGHTDNTGNSDSNLTLSKDRAKSAYQYLVDHGVESGRLSFDGFGDKQPIAGNDTAEGRKKNRRVEFKVK